MALFGNARRLGAPMDLEAVMGANGAYEVQPSDLSSAPPQGFSIAAGTPPRTMFGGGPAMSSGMGADEQRQRIAALRQQESQGYSPAQLRAIGVGEMPGRPVGGGGLFGGGGRKFLNGLGKAGYALAMGLTYGPSAPFVMRRWQQQEAEADAENDLRRAQAEYYRAQAGAREDGVRVVGNSVGRMNRETGQWETLYEDQPTGERERLLATLDDPNTPPAVKARIERVLNITPQDRERQPTYQTDDAGNVFEIGPGGVRKIGGGLYKRPPEPRSNDTTPGDVTGPILAKMARGVPLTPAEQQVLEYAKPTDPFDAMLRGRLGVGGSTMPPAAPPQPGASARAPGAMPGRRSGGQTSGGRYPVAPSNPAQRRVGAVYTNGRGRNAKWTAQGWEPVN